MTRVISVRGKDRTELLADTDFVYVGRKCAGWACSKWSNPFKVHRPGQPYTNDYIVPTAEAAVERYKSALERQRSLLPDYFNLEELRGKTLGCWCGDWAPGQPEIPCHAVVLAKLADATGEGS